MWFHLVLILVIHSPDYVMEDLIWTEQVSSLFGISAVRRSQTAAVSSWPTQSDNSPHSTCDDKIVDAWSKKQPFLHLMPHTGKERVGDERLKSVAEIFEASDCVCSRGELLWPALFHNLVWRQFRVCVITWSLFAQVVAFHQSMWTSSTFTLSKAWVLYNVLLSVQLTLKEWNLGALKLEVSWAKSQSGNLLSLTTTPIRASMFFATDWWTDGRRSKQTGKWSDTFRSRIRGSDKLVKSPSASPPLRDSFARRTGELQRCPE